MSTEAEKRLHRCCFTGPRPEELIEPEETVKKWLSEQIDSAIAAGYTTFISGCGRGVDIWAGQLVLQKKAENPALHLIAASPWPGLSSRWSPDWQVKYRDLLDSADLAVFISDHYDRNTYNYRNEWMVDHSSRVIALTDGAVGGTRSTIEYARKKGVEVISSPVVQSPAERRKPKRTCVSLPYPENLLTELGLHLCFESGEYTAPDEDHLAGLSHLLRTLSPKVQEMVHLRYEGHETLEKIGNRYGLSRERVRQLLAKALRNLRRPSRIKYVRQGLGLAELPLKIACAEEIKQQLLVQRQRYPLMNEEDVVKFVFQGMLGPGHLIPSADDAKGRLAAEMALLQPDSSEPLSEILSTDWVRVNLRPAKAGQLTADDLIRALSLSARRDALSFTRQNVYNFCVKLDSSDKMKAAAGKVLEEGWLPSHSEPYTQAYRPAYRVLPRDFRKLMKQKEEL